VPVAGNARTSSVGVLVPTIANSIFADTVQGLLTSWSRLATP